MDYENLTPQYRIEEYLEAIVEGWAEATQYPYPDYPSWRIEEFLDAFITYIWEDGGHPRKPCPEPVWRLEECLRAIYDVMTGAATPWAFPTPTNSIEEYLAAIHAYLADGTELPVPEPVWRIEQWLAYVLDAVKQGGGVEKTVSGTMVHITDALAKAALSVLVSIEPIQSLHGYSNPWPAGGGVNILDPNLKFTAGTYYGGAVLSTSDGYNITLSGTPTESGNIFTNNILTADAIVLPAGTYTSVGAILSTYKANGSWYTNRRVGTWTADEPFIIRQAYIEAVAGTTISGSRFIALAKGSTAPASWTPYSNICPISGRTGLSVYDDPKYGGTIKFNQKFPTKTLSYVGTNYTITSNNDGKFTVNATATASQSTNVNHTSIGANAFTAGHVYAWIGNSDKIKVDLKGYAMDTDTIFKATTASYNNIVFLFDNLTAGTYEVFPQLFDLTEMFGQQKAEEVLSAEQSSTGSGVAWFRNLFYKTYYPVNAVETTCVSAVNGDPYWKKDIDWTTQAGTVYGGTDEVVGGVLTDEWAEIPSYNGETITEPWLSSMDEYAPGATPTTGAQVVYKLATPLTYQLTAQEVQMLLGENNVWSSSGDTVSVTYYAEGNANPLQSLNILLGGNYSNPKTADDVSDKEALEIILGGNK